MKRRTIEIVSACVASIVLTKRVNKNTVEKFKEIIMKGNRMYMIMTIALAVISLGIVAEPAHALSGAIFTTDRNGRTVNGNIYKDKCDVYLDGGPGSKAPASSASLPEGWYCFQVTDPSGKVLLSSDGISDRLFYVNGFGVIDEAVHPTNPDKDGKDFGAVVVQLCPYDDTPNSGGVYKVWITRLEDYDENLGGRHGFIPALCKTDNFKVAPKRRPPEQYLIVKKFKDCNANGLREDGEQWLSGWDLLITPPDGPTIDGLEFQTPYAEIAWPGLWTVRELMPNEKWLQTALIINGIPQEDVTETATVTFGTKSEMHVVVFGNIPTGCITACKFYDSDADGVWGGGELGVEAVKMTLTGRDVLADLEDPPIIGDNVEIVAYTEADGYATFEYLFPGTYIVTEEVPTNCDFKKSPLSSATSSPERLASALRATGTTRTASRNSTKPTLVMPTVLTPTTHHRLTSTLVTSRLTASSLMAHLWKRPRSLALPRQPQRGRRSERTTGSAITGLHLQR
ncbi:MAG: hypothetical protein ACYSYV_07305 [Planctomycetota bacterium]|jgi:hypothetical protein